MIDMTSVSLQEITFETVRQITGLDVSSEQRSYVASNAVSIAEAHFNPGAWFRAIFADDVPVGFVMLLDPAIPGVLCRGPIANDELALWRLMIDHRYQRMGYGTQALDLVCQHARSFARVRRILSSYIVGPNGPERFYLQYGFEKTGRLRNKGGEVEIALPLVCTG
jgi:diamine N-acetyltransferase